MSATSPARPEQSRRAFPDHSEHSRKEPPVRPEHSRRELVEGRSLCKHLPLIAAAPGGIKKLRELILELAAKGALVPEDPEAPAKMVLLGEVAQFVMGQAPPSSECNKEGYGTVFVKTGEFGELYPEVREWTTRPLKRAEMGDVLICVVGATVGKLNLAINCAIGRSAAAIRPQSGLETRYLYLSLMPFTLRLRKESRGSAQGVIGKAKLAAVQIRYPSTAEQHRIVAKVDELMALCDRLEAQQADADAAHATLVKTLLETLTQSQSAEDFVANWQHLSAHFDTLFTTEPSIDALKQTLLQLAVMGKLVPQDPGDEPASRLVGELRGDDGQWLQRSKAKRGVSFGVVSQHEAPFALPVGWEWVSVGDLGPIRGGATPSKSDLSFWSGTIPWVSPKDMKRPYIDDAADHVSPAAIKKTSLKLIPPYSLLLVVRGMILAHSFPVAISRIPLCINQDMKAISLLPEMAEFVLYALQGFKLYLLELVEQSSHGTCKLKSNALFGYPFPLPPLAEQHRIVAKVDELMALCDQLRARFIASRVVQERLAVALAAHAVVT